MKKCWKREIPLPFQGERLDMGHPLTGVNWQWRISLCIWLSLDMVLAYETAIPGHASTMSLQSIEEILVDGQKRKA